MAKKDYGVHMKTRQTALHDLADSFGVHPPSEPVPTWWAEFDKWYRETVVSGGGNDLADEGNLGDGMFTAVYCSEGEHAPVTGDDRVEWLRSGRRSG